ncbi:MAG: hypothetical protein DI626_07495, partial [Micavibrio aeruginosavorus]
MRAEAVTEETRRAYDFQCIEDQCSCSMHWRRAVYAKGNADPRPPTFAKNRSSDHKLNCPGDVERIMHQNIDYVTIKDGRVNVRINFPMGGAASDRFPAKGYLSEQMKQAAENQKIIKPFSSIGKLSDFIEKVFGSLDSESAAEVVVNYQGKSAEWGKLFKGSNMYEMLYHRARNLKQTESGHVTSPIFTVVKPLHEMGRNEQGKRRFACEDQLVHIGGRTQKITPTIVCDKGEPMLAKTVAEHAKNQTPLIVCARPFYSGTESKP